MYSFEFKFEIVSSTNEIDFPVETTSDTRTIFLSFSLIVRVQVRILDGLLLYNYKEFIMNYTSRRYSYWSPASVKTPMKQEQFCWLKIKTVSGKKFKVEAKQSSVEETIRSLISYGYRDTDGTVYAVSKVKMVAKST